MKEIRINLPANLLEWLETKAKVEKKEVNELIQAYLLAGLDLDKQDLSRSIDKPPCLSNDHEK